MIIDLSASRRISTALSNMKSSVLMMSPDMINLEEPEDGEESTCSLTPIMAMQFPVLA